MTSKIYEPEFKKKIVQLHLEEGRTLQSLTDEYGVVKSTINTWCKNYAKECQEKAQNDSSYTNEAELMKENLRLKTAKVGGIGFRNANYSDGTWKPVFFKYIQDNPDVPLDFISIHVYNQMTSFSDAMRI